MPMTRLIAFVVTSIWLLILQAVPVASAAPPPPRSMSVKDAWIALDNPKPAEPEKLTLATIAIVRANVEKDLQRLVKCMENGEYLRPFAFPKHRKRNLEAYPFSTLMKRVAQCDNALAEKLFIRLAHSKIVSGKLQGGIPQTYERSIVIVIAMGYLHPKTDEIYKILEQGISGSLCMGTTHPLASLARIGDERSAKLIKKCLFGKRERWTSDHVPYYLNEIGRSRHRLPIFALLLELAKEAPTEDLGRNVLKTLVSDKSRAILPGKTQYTFPSYQAVPAKTRKQLQKLVDAVDTTKLSAESAGLIVQLKKLIRKD